MSEALLKVHSNISPITKSILIGSLGVTAGFLMKLSLLNSLQISYQS